MSERLVIRLGSEAGQGIPWVTWSEERREVISSGVLPGAEALSTLAERAGGRPVEVLVDSSALMMKKVALPAGAKRQAMRALPFLLEDDLAEDVESLHFVPGPQQGDQLSVAAVSHEQMQSWCQWLADAGLQVKKMVPDILSIPLVEDTELSLLELEGQLLLRTGDVAGMVLEPDWLVVMEAQLVHEERPWALFSPVELPQGIEALEQPLELPMEWLAKGFVKAPINLLSGAYAPARELGKLARTWSKVGIAAGILLVLAMGHNALSWHQYEQERQELRAEGERIYRQLFPTEKRVPNPRGQLEAKVRGLGGGSSGSQYLAMMAQLEPAFRQLPELRPAGIRFDGDRSEIRLQLTAKDFAQFEQFKELASSNFSVDTGALNTEDKGVSGTLTLRAKG